MTENELTISDDIQIFNNPEFGQIRTTQINGDPYFVGKDVAIALGYARAADAIAAHVDEDDKGVCETPTPGGKQKMIVINESGVYALVFSSKLPNAKQFKRWVTSEVLPTIRKHGAYMTPETLEKALLNPDGMIKVLQALKNEQEKRKALETQNEIMKPKAEYFDVLVDHNLLTNFTDTAKELGIKRKKFIHFLIEHDYLYRDPHGDLKPYAAYADTDNGIGLFHIKDSSNDKTGWAGVQTLVTVKGKETFRLLLQS